jgi:hypothetical protein
MTFWQRAEQMPPILVRLLARKSRSRPLGFHEIAEASGLPIIMVYCISESTSWDGVAVNEMRAFLCACRCDFCDKKQMRRVNAYVASKPTWQYLRKSHDWKTYYEPLMRRYLASVKSQVTAKPSSAKKALT